MAPESGVQPGLMDAGATVGALPDSNTVRVWRASISHASAASLATVLSNDERDRAARFAFDRDRNQFIVVRGWLRRLVGEYLNRSPADIRFAVGPQGKPLLTEAGGDLHFNVSHSGDVGLLAFCRGRELGVDVERTDSRVEIDELAARCFSTTELQSLHALPVTARADRFFQLWAAKEAYIKAIGGGLSIPLQEFSVDVRAETDLWKVATSDESAALSVRRITVPTGYAGAVAARGRDWQVEVQDLPGDSVKTGTAEVAERQRSQRTP